MHGLWYVLHSLLLCSCSECVRRSSQTHLHTQREDLEDGATASCATFESPCLAGDEDFDIAEVEVWDVGSASKTKKK